MIMSPLFADIAVIAATELRDPNCGYVAKIQYGISESRTWMTPELMDDGSLRFVGMSSRTDYDRDGNKTGYTAGPNGVVAYSPGRKKQIGIIQRIKNIFW